MVASLFCLLFRPENHHNTGERINAELFQIFLNGHQSVQDAAFIRVRFSWVVAIKPQLPHSVRVSFFWPSLAIAASEALDPPNSPKSSILKGLRRFASAMIRPFQGYTT
jgi:hypothetical protein